MNPYRATVVLVVALLLLTGATPTSRCDVPTRDSAPQIKPARFVDC